MRIGRSVTAVASFTMLAAACGASEVRDAGRPPPIRSAPPMRLETAFAARGPTTPRDFDLGLLVPGGARVRRVWFLHGGRVRDQVLVEWVRSRRASLYAQDFPERVRWGLTLWTQTPPSTPNFWAPWTGVAIPLARVPPGAPYTGVALADVTSDGHPDVLLEQYPHTNHGCGPHVVIATLRNRGTWRLFQSWLCETTLRGERGLLALDLPRYGPGDGVCCWSKELALRLRWNGRRYVTVSARLVRVRR